MWHFMTCILLPDLVKWRWKFQLGVGYTHEQAHIITLDQPCNPDFADDPTKSGPCRSNRVSGSTTSTTISGIPNPNYRAPINEVGRRFRAEDSNIWDAWVNGVVMF